MANTKVTALTSIPAGLLSDSDVMYFSQSGQDYKVTWAVLKTNLYNSDTFTNGDLVSGAYTFTHNLNTSTPTVEVWDNNNKKVATAGILETSGTNAVKLTLGSITGTWKIKVTV